MTMHRCPGRCGRSLSIHVDICKECARRDDTLMASPFSPSRAPADCTACGRAVAPGRSSQGLTTCSHCEGSSS